MTDAKPFLYYSQRQARARGIIPSLGLPFVKAFVLFVHEFYGTGAFQLQKGFRYFGDAISDEQLEVSLQDVERLVQGKRVPPDENMLDLVEFYLSRCSLAHEGFDTTKEQAVQLARTRYRDWVNAKFYQGNHPYRLEEDGMVHRHPSEVLDDVVWGTDLPTEDAKLRKLLLDVWLATIMGPPDGGFSPEHGTTSLAT